MTEQEVRKQMEEGFAKIQPNVGEMTNLIWTAISRDLRHVGNF